MAIFRKNKKQKTTQNPEHDQQQLAADLEKIRQQFSDVLAEPKQEAPRQRNPIVEERYKLAERMQKVIDHLEKKMESPTTPEQKTKYINKRMKLLTDFKKKCVRLQVNRHLLAKFDSLIEHFKDPLQSEFNKIITDLENLSEKEKHTYLAQHKTILELTVLEYELQGVDTTKLSHLLEKFDVNVKEEKEERKAQLRKDHWGEFDKSNKPREDASQALEKFREERLSKGKESASLEESSSEESPKFKGN